MLAWYQFKLLLVHLTTLSMDALHVLVGVGVWIVAAVITGSSLARRANVVVVLMIAVVNEGLDLGVEIWPNLVTQLAEGLKDILLTIALPVTLSAAMRSRPALFQTTDSRSDVRSES